MSQVRPLYRCTDVLTVLSELTVLTVPTQWWRGFYTRYSRYGFYTSTSVQGADYKEKIKERLPRGYAELFGHDDYETNDTQRDAGRPPLSDLDRLILLARITPYREMNEAAKLRLSLLLHMQHEERERTRFALIK